MHLPRCYLLLFSLLSIPFEQHSFFTLLPFLKNSRLHRRAKRLTQLEGYCIARKKSLGSPYSSIFCLKKKTTIQLPFYTSLDKFLLKREKHVISNRQYASQPERKKGNATFFKE